jgi:hypothetical protein
LKFESGQVYSVLIRDEEDNFSCLGHTKDVPFADRVVNLNQKKQLEERFDDNNILLIYIVTQEVLFNDAP